MTRDIAREIDRTVWDSIRKTLNKFRENPYFFFTESDIHSYFYHCLYSGKFQEIKDEKHIYLVHREYPTNFRYQKARMLNPDYRLKNPKIKEGTRGHYDISVMNPRFVKESSVSDIVNKNVLAGLSENTASVMRKLPHDGHLGKPSCII